MKLNTSASTASTDGTIHVTYSNDNNASNIYQFSEWQLRQLDKISDQEGRDCLVDSWQPTQLKEPFCHAVWDLFTCWPNSPNNTIVAKPCPYHCPNVKEPVFAYKTCLPNGTWEHGNWTNYTKCFHHVLNCNDGVEGGEGNDTVTISHMEKVLSSAMRDIFFYGSIISLILLVISLVIFTMFKSLQCSRISIHKNLVVSFILRYLILIIMFEPFVTDREISYRDVPWLCKVIVIINYYSIMVNIFWMLIEGLFLYNRIAVSVFSTEVPFAHFYMIGWCFPTVFATAFALCLHFLHDKACWDYNADLPYVWIIFTPIIIALVVNSFFLVKIICILVTKLTASNSFETNQVRKAVKATAVLLPLLGLTNLFFFIKPSGVSQTVAYHIINAILQVSQGIFVSVIYCFMNGEVQSAIRKKWERFRQLEVRGRRRSSRTSSFFLSQSENSHSLNKNAPTLKTFTPVQENGDTTR